MNALLWILAILSVIAAAFFTYRSDVRRAVPRPWLTAGLRALLVALVWMLLLAPLLTTTKQEIQKPVVVLLQDESSSIKAALGGDTTNFRTDVTALAAKLKDKYRVVQWGFGGGIKSDSLYRYAQATTDISAAITRAQEFYGSQNLGAIILTTDGRFNSGTHPLYNDFSLHAPLYSVALGDTSLPKDLRIAATYAPRIVAKESQFELRADIIATRCSGYSGTLQLTENGAVIGSNALSIASERFDKSASFTVKATSPGLHHYVLSAPVAAGEDNTANNRRDVFVEVVEEKKNILIAAAAPHPDVAALQEAMAGLDAYNVTVRVGADVPASFAPYQVVILHGLPGAPAMDVRGKAVWYIVTSATNTGALRLSDFPALDISNAQADAYPRINTGFSLFALPQRQGLVVDKLPPLSAAQGSITPGPGAQILFANKASGAPLWIVQPGNTSQALLLGEGLWRWRLYEYRYLHNHEVIDECIRQTVTTLAANAHDNPFRVELPKSEWREGENVSFNAFLSNPAGEQINTPEATLTLTDSAGKKQNFTFEKSGAAYRLNTGIQAGGVYTYAARTTYNGKAYAATGSFSVATIPLEAMESGADYNLLYSLSKKYGGSAVTRPGLASLYDSLVKNENIKPILQASERAVPLIDWRWFFFLILLVAVVEWLLRKYWLAQ